MQWYNKSHFVRSDMDLDEAKRISRALKAVAEKEKNRTYYTFETNISEMALDSAKTIDELIKMLEV